VTEIARPRPDRERERGRVFGRTIALFVVLPAAAAGATWLAVRAAPGASPPVLAAAVAALAAVTCLVLVRPRGGADLPALRRAGEVVYHAEEGIVTISARGLVLDLNPAAEKLFGYRAAEVANQPISLLLGEPPTQERSNLLRDTLPAGSILGLAAGAREVLGVRKNGETFALELTGNSMLVGEEAESVAFVRDVSKRKRAQRYLLAHYTATCVLAEAGSLREAVPRILQALGEALQWDAVTYWGVDPIRGIAFQRREYRSPTAEAGCDSEPVPTCPRGRGLVGRVWASGQPVWSEDPEETGGSSVFRGAFGFPVLVGNDVSGVLTVASSQPQKRDEQLLGVMAELGKQLGHFVARKRQEEALHETTQTLQSLVNAAPVAIHLVDPEEKVRLWNPSAERIFGWPAGEVLGGPLPLLVPEPADGSDSTVTPAPVGAQGAGLPTRCRRKNGQSIEVSLSTTPLRDGAGNVVGVLGIGMDLTEQRNLEHQLRQAQKMEAVGQLAGGIAHDFNNLLTVINGYCSVLLAEEGLGAQVKGCLNEVQKAGDRAAGLTRQLLAFSRKELARPRLLDLNETVANVKMMLRRLIGEDIRLSTRLDRGLGCVCADPGQLEQVLVNLVVNARDAMPAGGELSIETRAVTVGPEGAAVPELAPGRYARLTARDTGCGMDVRTLARAFEPFFTTKEVGKGSGLGLATVYGIVKQSGGHVAATSAVGKGTTFDVYLPIVRGTPAPGHLGDGEEVPSVAVPAGKETVLLAEDEDGLRALARRVLQAKGYTVLEANNGEEALRLAERSGGTIDLLVTDVVMPHTGGRAAAEALTSRYPSVKVLYMSGYTDDEILRNGVLRSDHCFLSKPFSPDELLHKVREVLDDCPEPDLTVP
jgi:two-component system, cell cycle sensor histidine kinase and response regulator CckA